MKKIGILGNPLSHSLSPVMHNAAIKHLKLNLGFEKWEIPLNSLEDFFSNLKKNQIIGGCVTIPFKEELFNYCSDLHDSVKRIGATASTPMQNAQWSLPESRSAVGLRQPARCPTPCGPSVHRSTDR